MNIIKESKDGRYIFILAEGEPLCVNQNVNYKGEPCRVLSCTSFVNEPQKFKAKLLIETKSTNKSYNN